MSKCLVEKLKDSVDNPNLPVFEPLEKIEVASNHNKFIDLTSGAIWGGSNNGHFVSDEIAVDEGDELKINNTLTYIPASNYCGIAFYNASASISDPGALGAAFLGYLNRTFNYGERIKFSDMPVGTKYIRLASNVAKEGSAEEKFNVFRVISL